MRAQRVATHESTNPETVPKATLTCANPDCGAEFIPTRKWQRYHSSACRFRDWKRGKKAAPAKTASTSLRRYIIHCVVEVE